MTAEYPVYIKWRYITAYMLDICGKFPKNVRFNMADRELLRLQDDFINGRYVPGEYRYFTIAEPKIRVIAVAPFRDRVVHPVIIFKTALWPGFMVYVNLNHRCMSGRNIPSRGAVEQPRQGL